MRRKNLMRLTAAMGMIMACSQVMQAAAPVWGNETDSCNGNDNGMLTGDAGSRTCMGQ